MESFEPETELLSPNPPRAPQPQLPPLYYAALTALVFLVLAMWLNVSPLVATASAGALIAVVCVYAGPKTPQM